MPEFAQQNTKSRLLETILKEEDDRKSVPFVNSSFEPSRVTECIRRILYRSIGTPYTSQNRYLDALSTKATVDRWVNMMDRCLNINVMDRDIVSADTKYNLTANVHALISMDNNVYVVHIQPVCNSDFKKITTTGASKKDVVEIIICMWMLEIRDGLILYSNNDNNDYAVFHVEPYNPIIKAIKYKCEIMMRHKIDGTLPDRPYKDDSSEECGICEFRDKCWK